MQDRQPHRAYDPEYPKRDIARSVFVLGLIGYVWSLASHAYQLSPMVLCWVALGIHSYWYQRPQKPAQPSWLLLLPIVVVLTSIASLYVAVVHLGWRPSMVAVSMGMQAGVFAYIVPALVYHLRLSRIGRAS